MNEISATSPRCLTTSLVVFARRYTVTFCLVIDRLGNK